MKFVRILAVLASVLFVTRAAMAADGEGTAAIEPADGVVAGSTDTITVTVTVGPSAIPVGGGVAVGLHHASGWSGLQITNPAGVGYMTVTGSGSASFTLEWYPSWAPASAIPEPADSIFHRVLFARVEDGAVNPGETVTFVFGANASGTPVQRFVEPTAEFHVLTDVDADGVYCGIAAQPTIEVLADVPHHLAASVPATIVAGESFEMKIRAEDQYCNFAPDYSGSVTVTDEDGSVVARDVPITAGCADIVLVAASAGSRRYRLSDGALAGRANPCRVFDAAPEYRIYWGDIHGHTSISDGLGDTAAEYFAFGRDVADLDVCALTDHGHSDWPQTTQAVQDFYEPGRYVTILAQEGPTREGHMNLYFRDDDEEHISAWPSTHRAYIDHVLSQYGTDGRLITGPHHFSFSWGGADYPFGVFDRRICRFVEVYSCHGASEYLDNPRPLAGAIDGSKFLQAGLAQGLRFGVIGSSDNHDSHPGRTMWGRYPGGLVAFMAPQLTREAIWDAFMNYRVYGTSFDRIYVEFSINDAIMGSDLEVTGPCQIDYHVIGLADNVDVVLLRNNMEIRTDSTDDGVVDVSFEDDAPVGENFYYLRVVQDNGERAWSTPIWVRRLHSLSVQSTPLKGVTITGDKPGMTDYNAHCDDGEQVNLTAPAVAADGAIEYVFVRWRVDGVDQAQGELGVQVIMDADHALQAVYEQSGYAFALRVTGIAWSNDNQAAIVYFEANRPVTRYYYRLYQMQGGYSSTSAGFGAFNGLEQGYYLFVATAKDAAGEFPPEPCRVWFYNKPLGESYQVWLESYSIDSDTITFILEANRDTHTYYVRLFGADDTYSPNRTGVVEYTGLADGLYYFVATGRDRATASFPPGGPARQFIYITTAGFCPGSPVGPSRSHLVSSAA